MIQFHGTRVDGTAFTSVRKARPSCADLHDTHTALCSDLFYIINSFMSHVKHGCTKLTDCMLILHTEFLHTWSRNMEITNINSFMSVKSRCQFSRKLRVPNKFQDNATSGSVADTRSRTDVVSASGVLFLQPDKLQGSHLVLLCQQHTGDIRAALRQVISIQRRAIPVTGYHRTAVVHEHFPVFPSSFSRRYLNN
jgi:hypothetical protein